MINYNLLPKHLRGAVRRYIENRMPPGDFLQAVISNNLVESFGRADEINILKMFDIVSFFYSEAPGLCWGSKEKMKKWIEEES